MRLILLSLDSVLSMENGLRILMILFNQVGRGTYWRALQLARSLANHGHTITVLATSLKSRLRFNTRLDVRPGVTIVETPDMLWGSLRSGWDPWSVVARIAWGRRKHFDIVHAFESRPNVILPALYWQRRRKARLVLDWCDWFGRGGSIEERPSRWVRTVLRPVETFFEERFRVWANGTTVINSQLRCRAIDLGVSDSAILDLPNGSDVDTLKPIPHSQARRMLGWPEDAIVIGYIGAIFQRDAVLMAQTFDRIYQAEPKAQLLLVGCNNSTIENLVASPNAVRRIGRLDFTEINPYLSACDICWLPLCNSLANRGRYPLKVNDYLAVGRPMVATAVGDVADLIRRGEFGLLALDQPDDLARQVLTLIRDPAQRERMGQRARQLAETEFSWELIGEKLERFYQGLLAGPGIAGRFKE